MNKWKQRKPSGNDESWWYGSESRRGQLASNIMIKNVMGVDRLRVSHSMDTAKRSAFGFFARLVRNTPGQESMQKRTSPVLYAAYVSHRRTLSLPAVRDNRTCYPRRINQIFLFLQVNSFLNFSYLFLRFILYFFILFSSLSLASLIS